MNLQKLILIVLQVSLFLNVFSIGLGANFQDATYLFRRPGELVRAILSMNVLMPLLALLAISIFDLNPAVKIALVALSVSPIPPILPNKIVKEGGSDAYGIGLLIAVGSLAIIFVPLALELVEWVRQVPLQMSMLSVAKVVLITVLVPIALGVGWNWLAPVVSERIAKPIAIISGIALLVCMVAIWIAAAPAIWALIGNGTIIALAGFVLVGLAVGHFLGGPGPENRTSLALSTASRHPGIAIALAAANFPEEKLVLPAVLLYLLVNAFASIPYLLWIKRRQPIAQNQVKA